MRYEPLASGPIEANANHDRINEDALSVLSNAAPQSGYLAYRPPQGPDYTSTTHSQMVVPAAQAYSHTSRHPTPPIHHPIAWPGIFPSCTPSQLTRSPAPSSGSRPSLFPTKDRYKNSEEILPWAESTHFRSTSDSSKPEIQEYSKLVRAPSKQYLRHPRHIRLPWTPGFSHRFPRKGFGALSLICLLTGSCVALLFAAVNTTPSSWPSSTQPPTYVSVLQVLMDLLTLCALSEGLRIYFWRRLMKGTTIGEIHDVHESRGLWNAIIGLCKLRVNKVGIATIGAALSMARGPMFQRALVMKDGVYAMDVVFMALGLIVSFTGVLAILPLSHGYWELGRCVSLNPLEIARAFGAPLFEGVDGNVTASDIEFERGHLSVRYGAVERNGEEKVLRIEETGRVNIRMPREGEILG